MTQKKDLQDLLSGRKVEQPTEIRKSILIIKSQTKSLKAIEAFLKNRDWKIHTTTNLKEAMTTLVTQKPSFVMISVDHPNKKVRSLPKLISQAFPIYVMVFSENSTTAGYKNLMDSGCNYKINPPVTGPAVERTINKILRDRDVEAEKKAQAERAAAMGEQVVELKNEQRDRSGKAGGITTTLSQLDPNKASGMINIEGGNRSGANGAGGFMNGDSSGSGPGGFIGGTPAGGEGYNMNAVGDLLKQLDDGDGPGFGDDESAAGSYDPGAEEDGGGGWVPSEGGRKKRGAAYDPGAEDDGESAGVMARGQKGSGIGYMPSSDDGEGGSLGGAGLKKKKGPAYDPTAGEEDSEGGALSGPEGRKKRSASGELPEEDGGAPDALITASEKKAKPELSDAELARSNRGDGPIFAREIEDDEAKPLGAKDGNKISNTIRVGKGSSGWEKEESIIVRGTQTALEEAVTIEGDGTQVKQKLEGSSNVACLIVESARFSGYLVAALGKNRKIDEKFMTLIRERLGKFLRDNGEPMQDKESMSLKIKKVDFEDWALEYADFLRKSVHEGEEIAMAFFPFDQAQAKVEESASVDMGAVKLDELQGDIAVDFNVYVYMPANKKYVLYTPRGSKFYSNQKERLGRMGVTHLHVKRDELQDVSKYRAQNYLNSKIAEYESRKKISDAA